MPPSSQVWTPGLVSPRRSSTNVLDHRFRTIMSSVIYRITYPTGKIYVGHDRTKSINYFGSAYDALIARDFTPEQRQSFPITRDILWYPESATREGISRVEMQFIVELRAIDPAERYNQMPPFRG